MIAAALTLVLAYCAVRFMLAGVRLALALVTLVVCLVGYVVTLLLIALFERPSPSAEDPDETTVWRHESFHSTHAELTVEEMRWHSFSPP
jgi:hypothetical protein